MVAIRVRQPAKAARRMRWIDIAKALAAWMVVTAHLLREGIAADFLAALSVSVFFLLTGVTMHPHKDLRRFLVRLVRRIVVPYLIAGHISILAYRLLGNYAARSLGVSTISTTWSQDLMHLYYGSSVGGRMKWNESLWFLPCYLVVIVLMEFITRCRSVHALAPMLLCTVCGMAGYSMIAAGIMGLPLHMETALLVMPLCGLGQYAGIVIRMIRRRGYLLLAGTVLFCNGVRIFPVAEAEAAGGSLSLRAVHLAGMQQTYGFLLMTTLGAVYLIYYMVRGRRTAPWLPATGRRSLDIVLWNKFPVLIVQVVMPAILPLQGIHLVGGTDTTAALWAMIIALPCMGACLVWTSVCRAILRRLLRNKVTSQ